MNKYKLKQARHKIDQLDQKIFYLITILLITFSFTNSQQQTVCTNYDQKQLDRLKGQETGAGEIQSALDKLLQNKEETK